MESWNGVSVSWLGGPLLSVIFFRVMRWDCGWFSGFGFGLAAGRAVGCRHDRKTMSQSEYYKLVNI